MGEIGSSGRDNLASTEGREKYERFSSSELSDESQD
ncbi:uncharacterized protein G2W53_008200 [Senna tora]|uniref:Uncharacterized protein n=1 Tax=Senna tora TaxID=362788 RepID=A0A834X8C2_9FABA|nr:uncharacterized protein G2W53_008200 [Senna tora]